MPLTLDLKEQFPALHQKINGHPLVYLDNAATHHRPLPVLQAMQDFSTQDNANVHRGVHTLSQRATDRFEAARETLRAFVNARSTKEIIFTKGCTEAVNLVAHSWGYANLKPQDEILLPTFEHHANIVPWQLVAQNTGAKIVPVPITEDCALDLQAFQNLLNTRTRVVALKHICNATGTVNPVAEITRLAKANAQAHQTETIVLVDGAQALAHTTVDVQAIDCDFYTMSAHKAYGPMGVGALYGRLDQLQAMPPYQGGGDMIRTVTFEKTTFNDLPNKFEPGTPNVPGAIGFAAALDWVSEQTIQAIHTHEQSLLDTATQAVQDIEGLQIVGQAPAKAAILSFTAKFAHPHDLGTILDQHGVAIRAGHHCCMPLMRHRQIPGTARASFAVYNTNQDILVMIEALQKAKALFS